jgi:hypothetical protein
VLVMRFICFLVCGLSLLVFRACIGICGGGLAVGYVGCVGCVGCGNRILACCKASLISFGEALNKFLNSCEDKKIWVVGVWI